MTGIVCNSDLVAMGAALVLARCGLTAGRDVPVIGPYHIEDAAL